MATKYGTAYPVVVDYGLSVERAIELGHYDSVNSDINSRNFPNRRDGTEDVVIELVILHQVISTENALRELDERGYRPANLRELLAFGQKYPDAERDFPVAALGSNWLRRYGDRFAPFIYREGLRRARVLEQQNIEVGWGRCCRFAAVRKDLGS